jgi:hypothetical protein
MVKHDPCFKPECTSKVCCHCVHAYDEIEIRHAVTQTIDVSRADVDRTEAF